MDKTSNFLVFMLLSFCFSTLLQAQTSQDLIGTWQAKLYGATYLQTLNEDGTYTFEVPSANYFERGTWQFDGMNFTQQWQDTQTGEARQETYGLEFLDVSSIVMSGGNLQESLYFTKVSDASTSATNPLSEPQPATPQPSTPLAIAKKDNLVRLPPPEAGEYRCSSSQLTVGTTFDPTGSPGSTLPVYGVSVLESLVGNFVLDGNGSYTVNQSKGAYSFDPNTNQVSFTGELAAFPVDYFVTDGWFTLRLNFLDENNNEVSSLSCDHASPNAVAPTTSTPNPGLPGVLGLHGSDNQIARVVAETGQVQLIGDGMMPYQAANGETIFVSNNGLLGDYPEFTILTPDGELAAKLEIDDSSDATGSSLEDIFATGFAGIPKPEDPILSPDGSLIAYAIIDDLGTRSVNVRQRNGNSSQLIAKIPDMTQPTWTNDGGLIMAGTEGTGGIYLTDTSFTTLTQISVNVAQPTAPALSPDKQTVIFATDNTLWSVPVTGGKAKVILNDPNLETYGYPAWSPDGQWLVVAAAEPNFEAWTWLLVLPVNGNTREAQQLESPTLDPLIVSRNSRITWH